MANTNVKIFVDAIDNASNVLKNIGKNVQNTLGKQAQTNVSGLASATSGLAGGFGKIAGAAGVAGAAIGIFTLGAAALTAALQPAIMASMELENSLTALSRISARFGEDAGAARQAAQELASDGLITVTTAANGLQKLMTAGLSLDKAIDLMKAYKDQAAFGKSSTIDYNQAVTNLAESFMTESSAIGNLSGQSENYSLILERGAAVLGKKVSQLTEAERVEAKYIGTMQLGELVQGDAAVVAGTMGGALSRLSTATSQLAAATGTALSPAVIGLAEAFKGPLQAATNGINNNMVALQVTIIRVVGAIQLMLTAIGGVFGAIGGLITGGFKGMVSSLDKTAHTWGTTVISTQKRVENAVTASYDKQTDAAVSSFGARADASDKASSKIIKDMQRETEEFERQMAKRNEAFQEQLDDLVRSHIDKKNSLMRDLAEENEDFAQKMADRKGDFDERMDDMVKSHEEKVKRIKNSLEDENRDYEESLAERTRKYEQSLQEMELAHESKVQSLQRQMMKEQQIGSEVNNWKYLDLKQALEDEQKEYALRLEQKKEDLDAENAQARAAHEQKLLELQQSLAAEDEAYVLAREKLVADELEQTERLKQEHNKRVANFQTQLDEENAILNKHNALVAEVQDKVVEDDITRLIKRHERENAEAAAQHAQKMKDLQEQGSAEGAQYGGAINKALEKPLNDLVTNVGNAGKEAGIKFGEGIVSGAIKAGQDLIGGFIQGIKNKVNSIKDATGIGIPDIIGALPFGGSLAKIALNAYGFKQAGGVVPGPVGAPVPIIAHGQEYVTPQGQTPKGVGIGGGGGPNITVNIGLYAGTESEKRNIARMLYSALVEVAQSQHKSVQEYMEPHLNK